MDALRAGLRRFSRHTRSEAHSASAVTYLTASTWLLLPSTNRLNAVLACHIIDINECALADNDGEPLMNTQYFQLLEEERCLSCTPCHQLGHSPC